MSATVHGNHPPLTDTPPRTMHPRILFLVGALSLCAITLAPSCSRRHESVSPTPSVSCNLSTNPAHIGDRVQVSLTAIHPSSVSVLFPTPQPDKDTEIVGTRKEIRALNSDWTKTRVTYTLQPFHTGTINIFQDTSVRFSSPETNYSLSFSCPALHVASLIPGSNLPPIRPLKGPYIPPMSFISHLKCLLILGLAALLILWAALVFLRRRRTPRVEPTVVERPPHEIALEALRQLKDSELMKAPDAEPFYVRLSQIIREYIELRFGIRAPELTTEEFVREAARSDSLSSAHRLLLEDFLREADMVKFARFRPDLSSRERAVNAALRFVQDTVPEPEDRDVASR